MSPTAPRCPPNRKQRAHEGEQNFEPWPVELEGLWDAALEQYAVRWSVGRTHYRSLASLLAARRYVSVTDGVRPPSRYTVSPPRPSPREERAYATPPEAVAEAPAAGSSWGLPRRTEDPGIPILPRD